MAVCAEAKGLAALNTPLPSSENKQNSEIAPNTPVVRHKHDPWGPGQSVAMATHNMSLKTKQSFSFRVKVALFIQELQALVLTTFDLCAVFSQSGDPLEAERKAILERFLAPWRTHTCHCDTFSKHWLPWKRGTFTLR